MTAVTKEQQVRQEDRMERTRQERLTVLLADLRAFSERADVSQEQAGRIEVALDELSALLPSAVADDARIKYLVLALRKVLRLLSRAQYQQAQVKQCVV